MSNTVDKKAFEWLNGNQLSYDIWNKKYRFNNESFDEWLERITAGDDIIKELILQKKFLYGGRILANRGLDKKGLKTTLSNCYVVTPPEDSIESIFETGSKIARTFSYGGGVGVDISKLRPKGAKVNNSAKTTSGAVSFMDFYSYITGLICQEGRRGALMISIDCNHPDIIDFINLKADLNVCTKANISIKVTDEFMNCVKSNSYYYLYWNPKHEKFSQDTLHSKYSFIDVDSLYYDEEDDIYVKRVVAKDVLMLLAQRNWEMGEPGLLYWDRISNYNMLDNTDFEYAGVNPCAEEPLPAGGSCLLSSVNLSAYVLNPFTENAYIDLKSLKKDISYYIYTLNTVLNEGRNLHPLEEQRESVERLKQIGLGIMGLADTFIKLGITYGSDESLNLIDEIMSLFARSSVNASLVAAEKYGCYPDCQKELLCDSSFITNLKLDEKTKERINTSGLYNSQLLTIAPTGSLSSLLQISSGAEPNYAFKYTRKTQSLNNKDTYYEVNAPIVNEYMKATGITDIKDLPSYFISAEQVVYDNRLKVQGMLNKYIDASISSTLNVKESVTVEDVFNIYMKGWEYKLKGCTIWRDNCLRSGILTKTAPVNTESKFVSTKAPKRPVELEADFYTIKYKGEQFTVVVGLMENKPYEIFAYQNNIELNLKDHKGKIVKVSNNHYKYVSEYLTIKNLLLQFNNVEEKTATLYPSQLLRHGVEIKYIIKTMKKVDGNIASFTAAICRVLAKYTAKEVTKETCPECGEKLIMEQGCCKCPSCGYSKCG